MDGTTSALAEFAGTLTSAQLTSSCKEAVTLRVIDTLGCAWGGAAAEPVRIAGRALAQDGCADGAHVIGGGVAPAHVAGFVNSFASRYLDFNDYSPRGQGHPSDMILPLLAAAERVNASGETILPAIAAAYQLFLAVSLGGQLKAGGWDTGVAIAIGAAGGTGVLTGLPPERIGDAIAIAAACGPALAARGAGHLSMWKAGAGPHAAHTGVFSGLLALEGMTGPDRPFEGRGGLWEKVTGEFDVTGYLDVAKAFGIERTGIKLLPLELHALAPCAEMFALRDEIGDPAGIESIDVETYLRAKIGIGGADRWDPQTRESADHSYPYLLAVALLDGAVTPESFSHEAIHRQDVRDLMTRISIEENTEFTAHFPDTYDNRLVIKLRDGRVIDRLTGFPEGHPEHPARRESVESKARGLLEPVLGAERSDRVIALASDVGQWKVPPMAELFAPA